MLTYPLSIAIWLVPVLAGAYSAGAALHGTTPHRLRLMPARASPLRRVLATPDTLKVQAPHLPIEVPLRL